MAQIICIDYTVTHIGENIIQQSSLKQLWANCLENTSRQNFRGEGRLMVKGTLALLVFFAYASLMFPYVTITQLYKCFVDNVSYALKREKDTTLNIFVWEAKCC